MKSVFKKKQLKKEIKSIVKYVRKNNLDGAVFRLKELLGDYQYDYRTRVIKEALFTSTDHFGGDGARWFLKFPKESPKKLAKKVMKFKLNG